MPRVNHVDVRNYKEPFLVIKWVRNNSDGLESAREFSSRFVYGSIMRDRDITTSPNERSETEALSIKVLNIGTYIDVGDLIYRAKKVFQITSVDSDQFNRQEQHIKATYVSDIEKQPDLFEYIKKLPFSENVKRGGFAYVDWVNSEIKKLTTKDNELNNQIAQTAQNLTQLINKNTSNDEKTQSSIKTLSSNLNEFKSQINANVEQLQAKDNELNNQIVQTNEILDDRTVKITENVVNLEQKLIKNIKTISDELSELEQKHKGDIFSVNSEIAQNEEQIIDIKDDILRTKQDYGRHFDNVKEKITNLTKQVNSNTEKSISQGAIVEHLELDNESISARIREFAEKNSAQDLAIESVQKLQQVNNAKILEIDRKREENVNNLSAQISRVSATNEEQNELINKLQLALTANTEADSETLRKFNELSEDNKQKHVELHVKIDSIERTHHQILDKTNKIDTIDNSVNVLNSKQARWDTVASQFDEFKNMSIDNGRNFRQFKQETTEEQSRQNANLSNLHAIVNEAVERRIPEKIEQIQTGLNHHNEWLKSLAPTISANQDRINQHSKWFDNLVIRREWVLISENKATNIQPWKTLINFNAEPGDTLYFKFLVKLKSGSHHWLDYSQTYVGNSNYGNVFTPLINYQYNFYDPASVNYPDLLKFDINHEKVAYVGSTSIEYANSRLTPDSIEFIEIKVYKLVIDLDTRD